MTCLVCHEELNIDVNWTDLFFPNKSKSICHDCESNLEKISGDRCRKCSRVNYTSICDDCVKWEEYYDGQDILEFNYSIYRYNSNMQDMIARWKYRGDYELGYIFEESFLASFQHVFQSIKDAVVVPIPLSEERLLERAFNQASMLASFLPINMVEALSRVHGEKQSKKSRMERISSDNPFTLKVTLNSPVILIDDIYTTGTTIRHAASLLKDAGCPNIYAYTLVRG